MIEFTSTRVRIQAMLFLLMALTVIVYAPGLSGDFEFDDGPNILDNGALRIATLSWDELANATFSGMSGPLGRPVSMATFALNYYFSEYAPFSYKATNIFIHLLAGAGVFFMIWQLIAVMRPLPEKSPEDAMRQGLLAAVTAGAWMLHPLNLTSVLYIVQRMTSLSGLFTFLAVGTYVLGRRKMNDGQIKKAWCLILAALGPITALGMLSKENAVLAPFLMFCVEIVFLRFQCSNNASRKLLIGLFSLILAVPLLLLLVRYDQFSAFITTGYQGRDFTLTERILTQPRVLFFYLKLLFMPRAGEMGLYHDDFPISSSLGDPPALAAMAGLGLLLAGAIFGMRRLPVLAFGILWFLIAHALESNIIALEMVHEHRNYVACAGPLFACVYYVFHIRMPGLSDRFRYAASALAIVILGSVTVVRSMQWANVVDHAAIEVHNHPQSVAANYQIARIYYKLYTNEPLPEYSRLAGQYFRISAERSTFSVFPLVGLIQLSFKAREPYDPAWAVEIQRRLAKIDWNANMDAISSLVACQVKYLCKIPHESMTGILQTIIDNPKSGPKSLGAANSLMGNYRALKMDDLSGAEPYLRAAIKAEPFRIEYQLDLVGLYTASGDVEAARRQLSLTRKMDKLNLNKVRLDSEEKMINNTATQKDTGPK